MNTNFTIANTLDKQEFEAVVGVAGLLAYNMKQTNNKLEIPAPEIIKVARNNEGIIIGGVSGSMYLSGIEIEYSFQAPKFYAKCGYTLCGEVDGFVDNISLYSFKKSFK